MPAWVGLSALARVGRFPKMPSGTWVLEQNFTPDALPDATPVFGGGLVTLLPYSPRVHGGNSVYAGTFSSLSGVLDSHHIQK